MIGVQVSDDQNYYGSQKDPSLCWVAGTQHQVYLLITTKMTNHHFVALFSIIDCIGVILTLFDEHWHDLQLNTVIFILKFNLSCNEVYQRGYVPNLPVHGVKRLPLNVVPVSCFKSRQWPPFFRDEITETAKTAIQLLRLFIGKFWIYINRCNSRNQRNGITSQNGYCSPSQSKHNSGIDNISPGVRQTLHGRDNGCYPKWHTPTDYHSFFCGME